MPAAEDDALAALPRELRETLAADSRFELAATAHLDVHATIEPRATAERPAFDRALGLLGGLRDGRESVSLETVLGEGGMGTVHLARQLSLDRRVAVKKVRDRARSPSATTKLLREAWVTGSLEHPNVVPVYDLRVDAAGEPQIVMKKIDGRPWSELLEDPASVRAAQRGGDPSEYHLHVFASVMDAVAHAHRRGIVHRDIKPENVMIGDHGEVYLVDWGIALALRDDGTGRLPLASAATELAGTPAYMAPEMAGIGGTRIDERTDVFLLGAVLLELATGAPPRQAPNLLATLALLFVPLEVPESVPDELAGVIRTATAPAPEARYPSVDAMRRDLDEYLAHRGSLELTAGAEERLERLLDEAAAGEHDDPDRRPRLFNLFGEARFGFEQALRAWSGNERARTGLERALTCMVELELADGDPRSAGVFLASITSPPDALRARVESARRAYDEEQARRSLVVDDHDPAAGQRTRAFVALVMSTLFTLGPLGAHVAVRMDPSLEQPRFGVVVTLVIMGIGLGLATWARESLSKSAINRGIVRVASVTLAAQLLLLVAEVWTDGPGGVLPAPVFVVWALSAGALASTVDARLAPSAVTYAVGFFAATAFPSSRYLVASATNFALLVNMAVLWGRHVEFGRYARERREARAGRE